MNFRPTQIAIAVSLAFVGVTAHAPARVVGITDGTSNPIVAGNNLRQIGVGARDGSVRLVGPAGSSLTTTANVSGSVIQNANDNAALSSLQTAAIGSANGVTNSSGTLSAQGSLVGTLTQSSEGTSTTNVQTATIGGLSGSLGANNVQANGAVQANLSQTSNNAGSGRQTIDVGGISDSGGGSLVSNGIVSADVTQSVNSGVAQEVRVGSITGSTVQSALTSGIASGTITQSTSTSTAGGANLQRVGVDDIRQASALSVVTHGTLTGAITQGSQGSDASPSQSVEIGSVNGTTNAGSITTNGTLSATVSQTAVHGNQQVLVGSVAGGAPNSAVTNATLAGNVSQVSGNIFTLQKLAVGAVERSTGKVSTDATVDATISQSVTGFGSGEQTISIASTDASQGDVATKATVSGTITQTNGSQNGLTQGILIGSAVNTGGAFVRTNATVNGTISQSATARTGTNQNILIGSVTGSSMGSAGGQVLGN